GRNFALGSYKDANNQERPCYSLTKTECLYVATKFNDEARAKLVLRWEQLEKERLVKPLTDMEIMARAVLISNKNGTSELLYNLK
ncbi:MAG: Rha family transcriptional regulator, partial [Ruminococcus sp.]|nr:Rha family transcriptional regulator [Ruminococcus sp.]